MAKKITPFSAAQLIPKEEVLEIQKSSSQLFIGIPKEIYYQEKRICLTPDAVSGLTALGHQILIESGAGLGAGYTDNLYSEAGATITNDTKKVFACPLVLKVEPPTIEEIEFMKPNTVLVSAIQLKTRQKNYFDALAKKKITALAFEFLQNEDGEYPATNAQSEIAGTASVLIAAELMVNNKNGNGLMFGNISGVPPVDVVIIGAGTVGEFAARSALGLGANIKVFDNNITRLRKLQTNLGRVFYTSTIQSKNLLKALKRCDVAIGALRGDNRAPVVVTKTMVENMKKGAVIIDVSIDMGGCFETSEMTTHDQPVLVKNGVLHYGVPNIPARYPKTSSISISNIFTPYLLEIAEHGGVENTIRFNNGLKNGLYFYRGILTSKQVSDWFSMPYSDINLLIF
jgi:alanine dehydrogenase